MLLLPLLAALAALQHCSGLQQGSAVLSPAGDLQFVAGSLAPAGAIATATFVDPSETNSNFGKLRVSTSPQFPDELQASAAGFLEGWLSAERIFDHHTNLHAYFAEDLYPGMDLELGMQWLQQQDDWVKEHIKAPPNAEPVAAAVWRAAGVVQAQFDGIVEGYLARVKHEQRQGGSAAQRVGNLLREDLIFLNNNGELYDILDHLALKQRSPKVELHVRAPAARARGMAKAARAQLQQQEEGVQAGDSSRLGRRLVAQQQQQQQKMAQQQQQQKEQELTAEEEEQEVEWLAGGKLPSPEQMLADIALQGKCTALIKVLGDLSDLYVGHSTWDSYTNNMRIYKHYEFAFSDGAAPQRLSFSSYPGEVFSDDDFYLSSAVPVTGDGLPGTEEPVQLSVVETTNHVFDPTLLDSLDPYTLPSWLRVRAAFMTAASGGDWVKSFRLHNSGTYNNQYFVLDLRRFRPRHELQPGLLWVVEQIPGLVQAADMTDWLAIGYVASYNVPIFPEVYNRTGYPKLHARLEALGEKYDVPARWLKYQVAPRAMIFRRDQGSVVSLSTMRDMMRYNNWKEDPYSENTPIASICGRGDLHSNKHGEARPKGCYDTKVTSFDMALQLQSEAVAAPTPTSDNVPFSWAPWDQGSTTHVHQGQPTVFDFTFEHMEAKDLPLPQQDSKASSSSARVLPLA